MTSRIFFPQPIKPTTSAKPSQSVASDPGKFNAILDKKLKTGDVKFSQHARQRMKSRNIELTAGDLQKLQSAVDKAGAKGARESLILIDQLALVVC